MRQFIAAAVLASLGLLSVGTTAKAALVTAKQPLVCEVRHDTSWGELYLHNVGVLAILEGSVVEWQTRSGKGGRLTLGMTIPAGKRQYVSAVLFQRLGADDWGTCTAVVVAQPPFLSDQDHAQLDRGATAPGATKSGQMVSKPKLATPSHVDPAIAAPVLDAPKIVGKPKSGITAAPADPTVDFTGVWSGSSDKGWRYRWTFEQVGNRVFGTYTVIDNGAAGALKGTLSGDTLTFSWFDNAGFYAGSGQLRLTGDAFAGGYRVDRIADNVSLSADLMTGKWQGTRQQ
jgi:hypothetical protein